MEAKAKLSTYRQSPRKVRLVADSVRGKKVSEAITLLSFVPKRAASPIQKLINSALANAKSASSEVDDKDLVVKEIKVDAGSTLVRRGRLSFRGGRGIIKKRTSHISVTLAPTKKKK